VLYVFKYTPLIFTSTFSSLSECRRKKVLFFYLLELWCISHKLAGMHLQPKNTAIKTEILLQFKIILFKKNVLKINIF